MSALAFCSHKSAAATAGNQKHHLALSVKKRGTNTSLHCLHAHLDCYLTSNLHQLQWNVWWWHQVEQFNCRLCFRGASWHVVVLRRRDLSLSSVEHWMMNQYQLTQLLVLLLRVCWCRNILPCIFFPLCSHMPSWQATASTQVHVNLTWQESIVACTLVLPALSCLMRQGKLPFILLFHVGFNATDYILNSHCVFVVKKSLKIIRLQVGEKACYRNPHGSFHLLVSSSSMHQALPHICAKLCLFMGITHANHV